MHIFFTEEWKSNLSLFSPFKDLTTLALLAFTANTNWKICVCIVILWLDWLCTVWWLGIELAFLLGNSQTSMSVSPKEKNQSSARGLDC